MLLNNQFNIIIFSRTTAHGSNKQLSTLYTLEQLLLYSLNNAEHLGLNLIKILFQIFKFILSGLNYHTTIATETRSAK
jgi:hypothetical protein